MRKIIFSLSVIIIAITMSFITLPLFSWGQTTGEEAAALIISNVQITSAFGGRTTITWQTNRPANSRINYRCLNSYALISVAQTALVIDHSIVFPKLNSGDVYHFTIISQDALGKQAINADHVLTVPYFFTLNIASASGEITCEPALPAYQEGSTVNIVAKPNRGYKFIAWGGDANSSDNPLTVTMDSNKNISAIYNAAAEYTVKLGLSETSLGLNKITTPINLPIGDFIAIEPSFEKYYEGETIKLTAQMEKDDYYFGYWVGDGYQVKSLHNPIEYTFNPSIYDQYSHVRPFAAGYIKIPLQNEIRLQGIHDKFPEKQLPNWNSVAFGISGNRVAWNEYHIDYNQGKPVGDVFLYDVSSDSVKKIADDNYSQLAPDIFETKVVWQDDKNSNWDIYMQDIVTNQTTQITNNASDQYAPKIDNDKIVYLEKINNNETAVYVYDLATKTEFKIDALTGSISFLDIWDNFVVTIAKYGTFNRIMLYDLSNNLLKEIASSESSCKVSIGDGKVVWISTSTEFNADSSGRAVTKSNINCYNIVTGQMEILDTVDNNTARFYKGLNIYKNNVVYVKTFVYASPFTSSSIDLVNVYDLTTKTKIRVKEANDLRSHIKGNGIAIFGNRVLWLADGYITNYRLGSNQPPRVNISQDENNLILACSDESDNLKYSYKIDYGKWSEPVEFIKVQGAQIPLGSLGITTGQCLYVKVIDFEGLESNVEGLVVAYNNSPQIASLAIAGDVISWTGIDLEDGSNLTYACKVDGGAWLSGNSARYSQNNGVYQISVKELIKQLKLSKGEHVFYLKAIDSASKESEIKSLKFVHGKENRLPYFKIHKKNIDAYVGKQCKFTLHADDRDGDDLVFSVLDKPVDMEVSYKKKTIFFSWTPSLNQLGKKIKVTSVANDGQGGEAVCVITFTVKESSFNLDGVVAYSGIFGIKFKHRGVNVSLVNLLGKVVKQTLTDHKGRYDLNHVPCGYYSLVFSKKGYKTQTQLVTLDKNITVDVLLKK